MKTKTLFLLALIFSILSCQKDEGLDESFYEVYATIEPNSHNMTHTILNPPIEITYELNGEDWSYYDHESIDIDGDGLPDFCFNEYWSNMDTTLTSTNYLAYGCGIYSLRDYQVSKTTFSKPNWMGGRDYFHYAPRMYEGDVIDSDLVWRNPGCGISIQRKVNYQMWYGSSWNSLENNGLGYIPIRLGDRFGWFEVQYVNTSTLRVLSFSFQE